MRSIAYLLLPDGTPRTITARSVQTLKGSRLMLSDFAPALQRHSVHQVAIPLRFRDRCTSLADRSIGRRASRDCEDWAGHIDWFHVADSISYLRKLDNFPVMPLNNLWMDTRWGFDAQDKRYVVETNTKIVHTSFS